MSTGVHAGLNVGIGSDDDPAAVAENRRRATDGGAARRAAGHALSGPFGRCGDGARRRSTGPLRPRADALVTDRPGLALGILTADCAPVLLADREAGVVGAAHAGWKGAIGGVTDSTIAAMESLGARRDRIAAAIGPCIARASYEVDDAFARALRGRRSGQRTLLRRRPRPGITSSTSKPMSRTASPPPASARIEALGLDTYADEARFFSFRRATHRGEPGYGRQIAIIGLDPA